MSSNLGSVDVMTNTRAFRSPPRPAVDLTEPRNLSLQERCIDLTTSAALNVKDGSASLAEIMFSCPESSIAMVSDVDPQLILKVFFSDPVRLNYVTLRATAKPEDPDASAPRTVQVRLRQVQIYSNRAEFDFSESDLVEPDQVVELAESDSAHRIALKGTRFTHVKSLQVFIVDNTGDTERTFLNELEVWGNVHPHYKSDYS